MFLPRKAVMTSLRGETQSRQTEFIGASSVSQTSGPPSPQHNLGAYMGVVLALAQHVPLCHDTTSGSFCI